MCRLGERCGAFCYAWGGRAGYEKELFALLVQLVRDMDRKIERQKERAQRESEPRPLSPAEQAQLDAVKARAFPHTASEVISRSVQHSANTGAGSSRRSAYRHPAGPVCPPQTW